MPGDDEVVAPTPEELLQKAQADLEALREENEKLKNKDTNFENLRGSLKRVEKMSAEEKKQFTVKEQAMIDRLAALEESVQAERTSKVETWKESALEKFAGEDEKTREKVLYHFNRLKGDGSDKASIESAMREAAILANADRKEPTAIPFSASGNPAPIERQKKNFAESEAGQELLKMMGHVQPKQ